MGRRWEKPGKSSQDCTSGVFLVQGGCQETHGCCQQCLLLGIPCAKPCALSFSLWCDYQWLYVKHVVRQVCLACHGVLGWVGRDGRGFEPAQSSGLGLPSHCGWGNWNYFFMVRRLFLPPVWWPFERSSGCRLRKTAKKRVSNILYTLNLNHCSRSRSL